MITDNRYTTPKLRLLSDLHMESFKFNYEYCGEDILVLAGDINSRTQHDQLLDSIPTTVQVIMVAGNHEYYGTSLKAQNNYLQSLENKYQNFKFLNNSTFVYNDIYFYGGMMCSDFKIYGIAQQILGEIVAEKSINDFRYIKNWSIQAHKEQFNLFEKGLGEFLNLPDDSKRVVISHFCPSYGSISTHFNNHPLNGYFVSDMEKYMGTIQYWFHGHTHSSFDYMKGDTRVVTNPKGYGQENSNFNNKLIIDLTF